MCMCSLCMVCVYILLTCSLFFVQELLKNSIYWYIYMHICVYVQFMCVHMWFMCAFCLLGACFSYKNYFRIVFTGIYIYVHIYICIYIYAHICIMCGFICIRVYVMHVWLNYAFVYIYICKYLYLPVYVYIYTYCMYM